MKRRQFLQQANLAVAAAALAVTPSVAGAAFEQARPWLCIYGTIRR